MFKNLQNVCAKYYDLRNVFLKMHFVKVAAFAWYSVKRPVWKTKSWEKANLHENWSIQTLFDSILNISAKCHQNRSL